MKLKTSMMMSTTALITLLVTQQAMAAIALDRTRVIFDGGSQAMSLSMTNENKQLPYLAQGWLEDTNGKKIESPLIVLPPVQRIEPGAQGQIKIQELPAVASLPQDRESLFYFNLREIPPRSETANTLQIALQSRIKLFYRPAAIKPANSKDVWQDKMTLTRQGSRYIANNPTPYYITLIDGATSATGAGVAGFAAGMVPPKGQMPLPVSAATLGNAPVLTYINDYGGRPKLVFQCAGNTCTVQKHIAG